MHSFTGKSHSRVVSMRGRSQVATAAGVVDGARREREQRQTERARTAAAARINAVWRSFAARRRWAGAALASWDSRASDIAKMGSVLAAAGRGPLIPPLHIALHQLRTLVLASSPARDTGACLRRAATLARMLSLGLQQAGAAPSSLAALAAGGDAAGIAAYSFLASRLATLGMEAVQAALLLSNAASASAGLGDARMIAADAATIAEFAELATRILTGSDDASPSSATILRATRTAQLIAGHPTTHSLAQLHAALNLLNASPLKPVTAVPQLFLPALAVLSSLAMAVAFRGVGVYSELGVVMRPAGVSIISPSSAYALDRVASNAAAGLLQCVASSPLASHAPSVQLSLSLLLQTTGAGREGGASVSAASSITPPLSAPLPPYLPWLAVLSAAAAFPVIEAYRGEGVGQSAIGAGGVTPSFFSTAVDTAAPPSLALSAAGTAGDGSSTSSAGGAWAASLTSLDSNPVLASFILSGVASLQASFCRGVGQKQAPIPIHVNRAVASSYLLAVATLRSRAPTSLITLPASPDGEGVGAEARSLAPPLGASPSTATVGITHGASACAEELTRLSTDAIRILRSGRKPSSDQFSVPSRAALSASASSASAGLGRGRGPHRVIERNDGEDEFDGGSDSMMFEGGGGGRGVPYGDRAGGGDGGSVDDDLDVQADRSVPLALEMARITAVGEALTQLRVDKSAAAAAFSVQAVGTVISGGGASRTSRSGSASGPRLIATAAALPSPTNRSASSAASIYASVDTALRSALLPLLMGPVLQSQLACLWSPRVAAWLLTHGVMATQPPVVAASTALSPGSVAGVYSSGGGDAALSAASPKPSPVLTSAYSSTVGGRVGSGMPFMREELPLFLNGLVSDLLVREQAERTLAALLPSWTPALQQQQQRNRRLTQGQGGAADDGLFSSSPAAQLLEVLLQPLNTLANGSSAAPTAATNTLTLLWSTVQRMSSGPPPPQQQPLLLRGAEAVSAAPRAATQALFYRCLEHALTATGVDDFEFHERSVPISTAAAVEIVRYTRTELYRLCWGDGGNGAVPLSKRPLGVLELLGSSMACFNNLHDRHNRRALSPSLQPADWQWPALPPSELSADVIMGIADDVVADEAGVSVGAAAATAATPSSSASSSAAAEVAASAAPPPPSAAHRSLGGVRYGGKRGLRQARIQLILTSIPHVVPFSTRVALFSALRARDHAEHAAGGGGGGVEGGGLVIDAATGQLQHWPGQGSRVRITVRRASLVADAFAAFYNLSRAAPVARPRRRAHQLSEQQSILLAMGMPAGLVASMGGEEEGEEEEGEDILEGEEEEDEAMEEEQPEWPDEFGGVGGGNNWGMAVEQQQQPHHHPHHHAAGAGAGAATGALADAAEAPPPLSEEDVTRRFKDPFSIVFINREGLSEAGIDGEYSTN